MLLDAGWRCCKWCGIIRGGSGGKLEQSEAAAAARPGIPNSARECCTAGAAACCDAVLGCDECAPWLRLCCRLGSDPLPSSTVLLTLCTAGFRRCRRFWNQICTERGVMPSIFARLCRWSKLGSGSSSKDLMRTASCSLEILHLFGRFSALGDDSRSLCCRGSGSVEVDDHE